MAEQDEKSQEATPHRRKQAREEGQVAQSRDLDSAVLLIVALLAALWFGGPLVDFLGGYTRQQLGAVRWYTLDTGDVWAEWNATGAQLGWVLLPILGTLLLTAVVVKLAQVGLLFLPQKLAFDLSRINPLSGLGRLFSLANLMQLIFGIGKLLVVGAVAWWVLAGRWTEVLSMIGMSAGQIAVMLLELTLWTSLKIAAALFLLAVLDYAYQWWKQEQDLRMSPDEVREEMKNLQGDPQVIARRRQVQRQLVLNRMKSSVPKADVVITNPTELAIALQYDPATMAAPVVVAKGAGVLAQRIRRLALEHGIPIVERKPLAQALYKQVDVGRSIPADLYSGVAEVLAYVYQLTGKKVPQPPSAAA